MERSAKVTAMLERLAACQDSSARILRASGRTRPASRAQMYAGRIRLTLDEPDMTDRMRSLADDVYAAPNEVALYERALDGAVTLLHADFGNVQISDPASGALRIAAQQGFGSEFLDCFSVVELDELACGRAAGGGMQTVVADVLDDPAFSPHRAVLRESGFRSVQSTPLIDSSGRVRGVLSTHFLAASSITARDLLVRPGRPSGPGAGCPPTVRSLIAQGPSRRGSRRAPTASPRLTCGPATEDDGPSARPTAGERG